jgi:mono/diheme cytochrome c family protein
MTRGRLLSILGALVALIAVSGCGSKGVSVAQSDPTHKGAELFASHCSGCHTLNVAGTIGSATKVRDRERVDGPNFNTRHETVDNVLYAIRNGGFSGAIMPENIVVGQEAQAVAKFLAKYAGNQISKHGASSGTGPTGEGQSGP